MKLAVRIGSISTKLCLHSSSRKRSAYFELGNGEKSEVPSRKMEVGSPKAEAGGRKSEVGSRKSDCNL